MVAVRRTLVRSRPSRLDFSALMVALASGLLVCAGCGNGTGEPTTNPSTSRSSSETGGAASSQGMPEPDQTYSGILGTISDLPAPSRPLSELQIAHEPIPNFVGRDGTIPTLSDGSTGMRAMTMAFPLGPNVSLDGLSIGQRVRFDFSVKWDHTPRWWITAIEPAP